MQILKSGRIEDVAKRMNECLITKTYVHDTGANCLEIIDQFWGLNLSHGKIRQAGSTIPPGFNNLMLFLVSERRTLSTGRIPCNMLKSSVRLRVD